MQVSITFTATTVGDIRAASLQIKTNDPDTPIMTIPLFALAGCTVLIVDHMPWATEENRKRLRSYGDVFKGAATRFGIYIDAEGKRLSVEVRGNNIRGFKKTPAYWDEERLELRLVDVAKVDVDQLDERVHEYVTEHPGASQKEIEEGVEGGRDSIRKWNQVSAAARGRP